MQTELHKQAEGQAWALAACYRLLLQKARERQEKRSHAVDAQSEAKPKRHDAQQKKQEKS